MFQRFLQWIREVIAKMIGTSSVKQALNLDVAISAPMADALQLWAALYENSAPWAREYKSMNLASAIAGEIARAATIEMSVEVTGSPRAEFLQAQIDVLLPRLRQMIEIGCAKGGLMLKPFVTNKVIAVDAVPADCFFPVAFDSSGNITACVFADQRQIGDSFYTRLEHHTMTEGGCNIRNVAYKSTTRDHLGNQVALSVVPQWADLLPEATITNIDRPLFAYFRYPLANNIDPTSPLGVSCYARATDLIKQADVQWTDFLWEFESGQRALYVDTLAFDRDKDGKPILPIKRLYRTLNGSGNADDEDMFHEWTPTLREANYLAGLDAILKRIEYACGLAYGTLSDPQTVDKTATEVATSRQRTFATITDTQKAVQAALNQLLYAMDVWSTLYNLAPAGTYSAVYQFDDSIIVDKDAQFQQDLRLLGQRVMSKVEFRMRNFGEDEATAKKKVAEAQAEAAAEQPTDFFRD